MKGLYAPMVPNFGFKRIHERKKYIANIDFSHKKRPYTGSMQNISLGGAYIISRSVNQFTSGDIISLSIPYTTGKKKIKQKGRVQWLNNEGFGLEFLS